MKLFDDRELFLRGNLLFSEEPDWDIIAWKIERARSMNRELRIKVKRALAEDGCFSVPFSVTNRPHPGMVPRRDCDDTEQDPATRLLESFCCEFSTYLGCEVDARAFTVDNCSDEDMKRLWQHWFREWKTTATTSYVSWRDIASLWRK